MTTLANLKKFAITNSLRSCQLFTGLPLADMDAIASITTVKSLERDEYLFHEGDPSHGFYIVQR